MFPVICCSKADMMYWETETEFKRLLLRGVFVVFPDCFSGEDWGCLMFAVVVGGKYHKFFLYPMWFPFSMFGFPKCA
jgi:hypothetical protein